MAVFDIETDGLNPTKIHCLAYTSDNNSFHYLTDYDQIRGWLGEQKYLVGHDIVRYDIPVLERILGIKVKAKIYDTLPMSWVMFTDRGSYGLDSFGGDYGIPKPKVDDWENLPLEVYIHRCTEDVKINWALWQDLLKRFKLVYGSDRQNMDRFFQYLSFKMKCAAVQGQKRWRLDKELASTTLDTLEKLQEDKVEELKAIMPRVPKIKKTHKPQMRYKKDGSLFANCKSWFKLLEEQCLPEDFEGPVETIKGYEEPNPNSSDQVKSWLFSLGWEPCTYDYKKNDDGTERKVPQVRYSAAGHPNKGELTESVKLLVENSQGVAVLEGLTVIQHRKSIFKNFLKHVDEEGYVRAEINGLTNTLRFQHTSPLVNLPGVDKPWGREVRGCLIAEEGEVLCGSDMSSLESTTKRHFIYPYDPDYVEEMSKPGFDEHLDLAVKANYLEKDDYLFYTQADEENLGHNEEPRFKQIKVVRKKFKPVNYSSVYGVGKLKMSRTTGMSQSEAGNLIEAYWQRNWAVKAFAKDATVKTVGGQMWVWNPVSEFWYTLRYEKDIFSTLNQGTGAYCFDTWLGYCMAQGVVPCGQFHDEFIAPLKKGLEQETKDKLQYAIQKTNEKLKLNVDLSIDVQFGGRYSEIH